MGYENYFKALLSPMRVYNLESGIGASEFAAAGGELDRLSDDIQVSERECVIATAESYGLTEYEDILPKRPIYKDISTRRDAISALLSIDDMSFTLPAINKSLVGCGIAATAEETETWYKVNIKFPGTRGVPQSIERLKERIEAILPCHIECTYTYVYLSWNEFETAFINWADLESKVSDWNELESYELI